METQKKPNSKKKIVIIISVSLAIIICVSTLLVALNISKNRVKDPIMEYDGQKISLSFYELMLSRMKGELARGQQEATEDAFWLSDSGKGNKTNEMFYNDEVLENCKVYLAALSIFDEMKLSLPQSYIDKINEDIEFFISYDGNDSKDEFNRILSEYGCNIESLRQAYIIEAKTEYLKLQLYGNEGELISDSVKNEFYNENYHRFKQIFIANFYYEYISDDEGNNIYFDKETGKPLYDKEKGKYKYDEDGNTVKDKYGEVIYYDEEGNILYDTENGALSAKNDEDGNPIMHYYSETEKMERLKRADEILSKVSKGNFDAFEAEMAKGHDADSADKIYADGYYLSDIEASGYTSSMKDRLNELKDMQTGDIRAVTSEDGCYIIMKYELNSGAFSNTDNDVWFESLNSELINKLFLERCQKICDEINIIDKNLSKAKSIKDMGINFNF